MINKWLPSLICLCKQGLYSCCVFWALLDLTSFYFLHKLLIPDTRFAVEQNAKDPVVFMANTVSGSWICYPVSMEISHRGLQSCFRVMLMICWPNKSYSPWATSEGMFQFVSIKMDLSSISYTDKLYFVLASNVFSKSPSALVITDYGSVRDSHTKYLYTVYSLTCIG